VHLDVRFTVSPLAVSRIGIVVPRHQHSAVDRNRLKRQLRELVRLELIPALRERPGVDIAIRARREAYSASYAVLQVDVKTIVAGIASTARASAASGRAVGTPTTAGPTSETLPETGQ
jgi:ribonuclease P protein component